MITAAEARELRPRVDLIDRIKDEVERAIRNVAIAGRQEADVHALIPNFIAQASGKRGPDSALDQLKEALTEAGYTYELYEGGPAGRPFFRVSWSETEKKRR